MRRNIRICCVCSRTSAESLYYRSVTALDPICALPPRIVPIRIASSCRSSSALAGRIVTVGQRANISARA